MTNPRIPKERRSKTKLDPALTDADWLSYNSERRSDRSESGLAYERPTKPPSAFTKPDPKLPDRLLDLNPPIQGESAQSLSDTNVAAAVRVERRPGDLVMQPDVGTDPAGHNKRPVGGRPLKAAVPEHGRVVVRERSQHP